MIMYDPAERAELLPDGRYLVSDRYRPPRVISADGSVAEPSPSEIVALRALLDMKFRRPRRINEENERMDNGDD